jgi:hypothetical protein
VKTFYYMRTARNAQRWNHDKSEDRTTIVFSLELEPIVDVEEASRDVKKICMRTTTLREIGGQRRDDQQARTEARRRLGGPPRRPDLRARPILPPTPSDKLV